MDDATTTHERTGIRVTDGLTGEHALFYALFDRLEAVLPDVETTDEVHRHARVLRAALESHAEVEETCLLEDLTQAIPKAGPVDEMHSDHETIQNALRDALAADGLDEARRELLYTVDLARDHFEKEERMLFPKAEKALDDETLVELGRRWAKRRGVLV